jgi:hypothetical protein
MCNADMADVRNRFISSASSPNLSPFPSAPCFDRFGIQLDLGFSHALLDMAHLSSSRTRAKTQYKSQLRSTTPHETKTQAHVHNLILWLKKNGLLILQIKSYVEINRRVTAWTRTQQHLGIDFICVKSSRTIKAHTATGDDKLAGMSFAFQYPL